MELIVVGLLGAVLFLGPDEFGDYFQPNQQEQVVDAKDEPVQKTSDSQQLNVLSKRYDPLEPGEIYVKPEIDSVAVNQQVPQETKEAKNSGIDKAAAKIKDMTRPITTWYEQIKYANKIRADRHSFVRKRRIFD